jgi:hypothetical protein
VIVFDVTSSFVSTLGPIDLGRITATASRRPGERLHIQHRQQHGDADTTASTVVTVDVPNSAHDQPTSRMRTNHRSNGNRALSFRTTARSSMRHVQLIRPE